MLKTEYNNIKEIIKECTQKYKDNNAFIIKKNQTYEYITYERFGNEIKKLGTALLKLGLKDKRVAVISKNRYEWALGYYAVVNGLGIIIPIDKSSPDSEIESSLIRSKADAIIFEEKHKELIEKILADGKIQISLAICMDNTDSQQIKNLEDLLKLGEEEIKKGNDEYDMLPIDNEKTSILLFTSGTTSLSKVVELSHKNIASNICGLQDAEKIYETDVNMAFLPFHHTFGSTGLLFFLSCGATTVFCDGLRHVQKNLKEYKVSVFFCVPLIIESMHKKIIHEIEKQNKTKKVKIAKKISKFLLKFGIDIRRKLFKDIIDNLGGNIRFVISGAAAIDKKVIEDFNDFGIFTIQGYGLTETAPVLCAENDKNMRAGSIGKPLYNVELKIDNKDENGVGEIIAKGPNIMNGYYENEEETKEVLRDGWFYTGDLGYQDKDGYFYISGRKKNVIVLKNGKNVFPEELELLISNLPYVKENMVFGVQKEEDVILSAKIIYDEEYVKEHYKNIELKELKEKIWQDIKQINEKLSNFKHIKNIIVTATPMIKTTTNKIIRAAEIASMKSEALI